MVSPGLRFFGALSGRLLVLPPSARWVVLIFPLFPLFFFFFSAVPSGLCGSPARSGAALGSRSPGRARRERGERRPGSEARPGGHNKAGKRQVREESREMTISRETQGNGNAESRQENFRAEPRWPQLGAALAEAHRASREAPRGFRASSFCRAPPQTFHI